MGKCSDSGGQRADEAWALEADSGLSKRYGLLVARVLVTAAEKVPIRVANVTETNVSHTVRNCT